MNENKRKLKTKNDYDFLDFRNMQLLSLLFNKPNIDDLTDEEFLELEQIILLNEKNEEK